MGDIGQQVLLVVDIDIDGHVAARAVGGPGGVADVGVGGPGGDHHLLDRLSDLFLAAALAGSQLPDRPVHIGLAPQLTGAVVEQVEVVGVVAFLLDDLELDVLVIEIGGVGLGILVRKGELAGEEEMGNLAGS